MAKNTTAQGGKGSSAGRVHTPRDLYQELTDRVRSAAGYADDIAAALATKGGHLFVSSGGAISTNRTGSSAAATSRSSSWPASPPASP